MNETAELARRPLWLSMEDKIRELSDSDIVGEGREDVIRRLARELDDDGYNVSRDAGNMLQLRAAVAARADVGRPLMAELDKAVEALTLDDLADTYAATMALSRSVGQAWPQLEEYDRRRDILDIVEHKKLALLVARAEDMEGDRGIRYLISEQVEPETIIEALSISRARFDEVTAAIAAEQAEKARVAKLLEAVADQSAEDRARHLIAHDVSDLDIVALAGIEQAAIDAAREAMAEELREKQRLAEEAAAAKKAAAEGPALEAIPPAEMLEHIEAIREIMEFSEDPNEIRQMCEQSNIPNSLIDVAVADPDKLDELERAAEG